MLLLGVVVVVVVEFIARERNDTATQKGNTMATATMLYAIGCKRNMDIGGSYVLEGIVLCERIPVQFFCVLGCRLGGNVRGCCVGMMGYHLLLLYSIECVPGTVHYTKSPSCSTPSL